MNRDTDYRPGLLVSIRIVNEFGQYVYVPIRGGNGPVGPVRGLKTLLKNTKINLKI